MHPSITYTTDDSDLSMDVHQTPSSLLDLITRNLSSSWPQPIFPILANFPRNPSSSIFSRISSPTHVPLITPNYTTSSHSHWSDLVQYFQSSEFQYTLDYKERPSIPTFPKIFPTIPQPSSSKAPTLVVDPYFFFNANRLAAIWNNLA